MNDSARVDRTRSARHRVRTAAAATLLAAACSSAPGSGSAEPNATDLGVAPAVGIGLTDAQVLWCHANDLVLGGSRGGQPSDHITIDGGLVEQAAKGLGILPYEVTLQPDGLHTGDVQFRSPRPGATPDADGSWINVDLGPYVAGSSAVIDRALDSWRTTASYARACVAAWENRSSQ